MAAPCIVVIFLLSLQFFVKTENVIANESIANASIEENNLSNISEINTTIETTNLTFNEAFPLEQKLRNETGRVVCNQSLELTDEVQLINGTVLLELLVPMINVTTNTTLKSYDPAACIVVVFYSPYCVFSASMAPYFNALPRFYDNITFYAIDITTSSQLNMRFGLVAVPTILLFHNGRAVAKFNQTSPSLKGFEAFFYKHTLLTPIPDVPFELNETDYLGPLSSKALPYTDWLLVLSWLLVIACCAWVFSRSNVFLRMLDTVKTTWREAQQQQRPHED